MAQLLSMVRNALAGILNRRASGNVVIGSGDGRIVINRQKEFAIEEMRVIPGMSTLRHSPFSDNFTLEDWQMKQEYRRWAAEPAVKAALTGKVQNVAALGLQTMPADKKSERERDKADFIRHCLQKSQWGFAGIVWEILIHGCMDGWSLCEPKLHEEQRGKWRGKWTLADFKSKDTRFVIPMVDAYRNVVGLFNHRSGYHEAFDPEKYVLYSHLPLFHNPTGQSDLRASIRAMRMITAVIKLRMIFLDKYCGPFIHGKTRDINVKARMAAELAKARADGFIVTDRDTDIQLLDLATRGTADFQAALDDMRKEVATGISGAFLHMMTAADPNARGDSQVQKDTVELGVWWLAEMVATVINNQLVPRLIDINFGATEDLPTVSLEAVRPEDIKSDLGIDVILDQLGYPLSMDELGERGRRSPARDDADNMQLVKKKWQTQPQQSPGIGGAGGMFGGGSLPFSEQLAEAGLTLIPLSLLPTLSAERVLPDDDWEVQAYDSFAESAGFTGTKKDRLGRTLCYRSGIRVPCQKSESGKDQSPHPTDEFAKRASKDKAARQATVGKVMGFAADPSSMSEDDLKGLGNTLSTLSKVELGQMKKSLAVKGGQRKQEYIDKIRSHIIWQNPPDPHRQATSDDFSLTVYTYNTNQKELRKPTSKWQEKNPFAYQVDRKNPVINANLPDQTRPIAASKEEAEFLNNYSWGYDGELNRALRETGKPPAGKFGGNESGKPAKDGQKFFDTLTSFFNRATPFRPPVTVWRGIKDLDQGTLDSMENAARKAMGSNGLATIPGFQSTSTDPEVAAGFGTSFSGKGQVAFKIAAVHGVDMGPYTHFPGESEMVLPHNSRYRVKSVKRVYNNLEIELEQVYTKAAGMVDLSGKTN